MSKILKLAQALAFSYLYFIRFECNDLRLLTMCHAPDDPSNISLSSGDTTISLPNSRLPSGDITISLPVSRLPSGDTTISLSNSFQSSGDTTINLLNSRLPSGDTTISLPKFCSPTPEMTDNGHLNNAYGDSEPVTESPAQENLPLDNQDETKPESNISDPEGTISEPTSESSAQEHVRPNHEDALEPEPGVLTQELTEGSEPKPQSPAQERLYPRGYEAEESAPIMAIHPVINYDSHVAVPFLPRVPTFQTANVLTQESIERVYVDGFGRNAREYRSFLGCPDSQQGRRPTTYDGPPEHSWREGNTAEASRSSVGDLLYAHSQTGAGPQVRHPWDPSEAAQPNLNQHPRRDAPFTTSNTVSHGTAVFPPVQTNTHPLPETSGPYRNEDRRLPLPENTMLPPITELVDSTRADRELPPRKHHWIGHLPNVYESRRLEKLDGQPTRLVAGPTPPFGQPTRLVAGPTPPFGPPMKPFDGPRVEAMAQKQWRCLMLENDRRNARKL